MKFAIILLLAAFVAAEPPSYRSRFFQRQEEREPTTPRNEEAPYPAAGYKPSKEFKLPSRQEAAPPATSYGVPSDSYAVPFHTYAAPETEYGVPRRSESEEPEREKNDEVENLKVEGREETKGKLQEDAEVVNAMGAYYILLPDYRLQKVQYQTQNDVRNMAYTARLQYRNEDRAPIYAYTVPQVQNAAYTVPQVQNAAYTVPQVQNVAYVQLL